MLGYSLEVVSSAWDTFLDPVLLSGGASSARQVIGMTERLAISMSRKLDRCAI